MTQCNVIDNLASTRTRTWREQMKKENPFELNCPLTGLQGAGTCETEAELLEAAVQVSWAGWPGPCQRLPQNRYRHRRGGGSPLD